MNCLLLLIILCCCNNGNNWGDRNTRMNRRNHGNGCRDSRNAENRCATANVGNRVVREDEYDRAVSRRDCDCDNASSVQSCPTAPPRTQFPYLDVEPRTCGCEEKSDN